MNEISVNNYDLLDDSDAIYRMLYLGLIMIICYLLFILCCLLIFIKPLIIVILEKAKSITIKINKKKIN